MKSQLFWHVLALTGISKTMDRFNMDDTNYGNIKESAKRFLERAGKDTKSTTPEDDVFYFFSLHDYNKDHFLDGHELGLAFIGYEFFKGHDVIDSYDPKTLEDMIDHTLKEDDLNNDGKISWEEYLESQKYHHVLTD